MLYTEPLDTGQMISSSDEVNGISPVSSDTIRLIVRAHKEYQFALKQRMRIQNGTQAFIRTILGFTPDMPAKQTEAIKKQAATIMKNPEGTPFEVVVTTGNQAAAVFETTEKNLAKIIEKAVRSLPIWTEFAADVKGFGAKTVGHILGECHGDPGIYPTHHHFWKRMGLAVIDGNRQGKPGKGASAEDWIRHGYSPSRRSVAWNINEPLIKHQIEALKDEDGNRLGISEPTGYYGKVYLDRKAYEREKHPDLTPKHIDNRARRYTEKRLLKHFWQAWRRVNRCFPA